jgi:CheY-like chemotaxis protein
VATSKILVIDDSRVIRKTVRDMLPEGDFEVIEAKDGIEGINFVEKEHPSLIMLDFILPKMSGWDVFQQIQADPEFQKIPLVLMSGKKEEVTSKISEPFEFFEFIEKPFDRIILKEAIQSAMTKARKARPRVASADVAVPNLVAAGEFQVSSDELDRLHAQIDRVQEQLAAFQTASSTQIQSLQAKLVATESSHSAQIQDLMARFEAARQGGDAEPQVSVEKVIHLETEVDTLKKQLGQLIVLIKKKFA